jgi:nitrite reductase/ring-hydroxylating ferredoxin subunit
LYTFLCALYSERDSLSNALRAEHYTQGETFQSEKQQLFAVAWLPLGVVEQLAQAGDFVSANIGGWPVFAVRGVVRALMKTCRHKKMLLVDQAQGHCEIFRCRFHGWTYGLDGRFRDAPLLVAPVDPASSEHHLTPLRVEIAHRAVFVNLSDAPAGGDYAALAARAGEGDYLASVATEINCNWKTLLEHVLVDEPAAAWQSPLMIAHAIDQTQVIEQIMPRSFLRTRLISHVYGKPGAPQESALAGVRAYAGELQKSCEALQIQRAAGVLFSSEDARVAQLHQQVTAACALPVA